MEIYLVRHGVTGGNIARRHQLDSTPLTVEGILQAKTIAATIARVQPTHIFSSPVLRAVETASLIGAACNIVPQTSAHFRELVRPVKLHGHFHRSLYSLLFYARWYFGLTNPEKDGGETYEALRVRIGEAQATLETYPADARIVVVSHSVFINFFLVHLCQKKAVSLFRVPAVFLAILRIPNTAVIKVQANLDLPAHMCRWSVDKKA